MSGLHQGDVGVVEVVVGVAVVTVAVVALVTPKRLASAVSFLVFGVLLAVLWALAGAPDVALAEAAIGAGVTGVLFVETVTRSRRAGLSRPQEADPDSRPDTAGRSSGVLARTATVLAALTLAAALTPALWRAARPVGDAATGLSTPVQEALPRTGVEHGVTGVLLNLRSYDTLLEIAVLLVAVLAVLAVSRPLGTDASRVPGSSQEESLESAGAAKRPDGGTSPLPSSPVAPLQRAATGLLVPVLLLTAAWILFAGTSRTGGAFQSGALLAAVIILLHLAGRPVLPPGSVRAGVTAALGVLAFVAVAVLGPLTGRAWLELDPSTAGLVIVVLETLLTVTIGASLALVALAIRGELRRPLTAAARTRGRS